MCFPYRRDQKKTNEIKINIGLFLILWGTKDQKQSTFSMVTMGGLIVRSWWSRLFFCWIFPSHRPSTSEGIPHPREIFCPARNGLSPASTFFCIHPALFFFCHPGSFLFSFPSFGLGTGLFDDVQLPFCIISRLIFYIFFFFPLFLTPTRFRPSFPPGRIRKSCRMTA